MNEFAELYRALDATTKINRKVRAMAEYFVSAPSEDVAWAVSLLIGRKPKRAVNSTRLQEWATEAAELPTWLFAESYDAVGDLAETIALLLPQREHSTVSRSLAETMTERILPLAGLDDEGRKSTIVGDWAELSTSERFIYNKLITGAFRVGVSQELVVRALAEAVQVPATQIAHRLMGHWEPGPGFRESLQSDSARDELSRPYPFMLAYALETEPDALGDVSEWAIEWKWDGIRAQLIRRGGETFIWSRGEDLVTERFPEIAREVDRLPDGTVIDGEILAWKDGHPLPFAALQQRIGRKNLTPKVLAGSPVRVVAYDLLEAAGEDIREWPYSARRAQLSEILSSLQAETGQLFAPEPEQGGEGIMLAEDLPVDSWTDVTSLREQAREHHVEGLMLKRRDSAYLQGRRKGGWWKWKVDPLTVDAVLVYAQRGSGKRASLYTDYTFALWNNGELVPFAKAYSGLTNAEIAKVDSWVRRNTKEAFGPVRTVTPELVMELAFEGIQLSNRHKSGVAVRFPRILRWRTDKRPEDADTLETVTAMIRSAEETT